MWVKSYGWNDAFVGYIGSVEDTVFLNFIAIFHRSGGQTNDNVPWTALVLRRGFNLKKLFLSLCCLMWKIQKLYSYNKDTCHWHI